MKRIAQILVAVLFVSALGTSASAKPRKANDDGGYDTPQRRDTLSLVTPSELKKAERLVAKKLPEYIPYRAYWHGEWERGDNSYYRRYIKAEDWKRFGHKASYTENEGAVRWMTLTLTMSGEIVAICSNVGWDSKRIKLGNWWPR